MRWHDWIRMLLTSEEAALNTRYAELKTRAHLLHHRDGSKWTIATNGRAILWLQGEWGSPLCPSTSKHQKMLWKFFAPEAPHLEPVAIGVLKAWLEPPQWEVPCPSCKGTARVSLHVICTFCHGDGVMSPEARPGWLCGVPIDREMLAQYVAGIKDDDSCLLHGGGEDNPLWLVGDTWRVAIMPMTTVVKGAPPDERWSEAPRYGDSP